MAVVVVVVVVMVPGLSDFGGVGGKVGELEDGDGNGDGEELR